MTYIRLIKQPLMRLFICNIGDWDWLVVFHLSQTTQGHDSGILFSPKLIPITRLFVTLRSCTYSLFDQKFHSLRTFLTESSVKKCCTPTTKFYSHRKWLCVYQDHDKCQLFFFMSISFIAPLNCLYADSSRPFCSFRIFNYFQNFFLFSLQVTSGHIM